MTGSDGSTGNAGSTGSIRIGTSSWSAKDWVGPFYPEGTAPGDFLSI